MGHLQRGFSPLVQIRSTVRIMPRPALIHAACGDMTAALVNQLASKVVPGCRHVAIEQRGSKRANVDSDGLGLPIVRLAQPSRKIIERQSPPGEVARVDLYLIGIANLVGLGNDGSRKRRHLHLRNPRTDGSTVRARVSIPRTEDVLRLLGPLEHDVKGLALIRQRLKIRAPA